MAIALISIRASSVWRPEGAGAQVDDSVDNVIDLSHLPRNADGLPDLSGFEWYEPRRDTSPETAARVRALEAERERIEAAFGPGLPVAVPELPPSRWVSRMDEGDPEPDKLREAPGADAVE